MKPKEQKLISVILPCYNQAIYLSEALDSVFQQSYQNWEAIVVNDGSSDDTEIVALEYVKRDPRVKYISKENGGLSSARNRGIELANGEFILPLDSDDIIKSEYMEEAIAAFENNSHIKLVYCQGFFFGTKNELWDLSYQGYKNLLLRNAIFCSAFFRKSDWVKIGGYDEKMLKGHEDWDFYIRLLENEGVVYQIQKPLFYYRIKESSLIGLATRKDVLLETEFYLYSKYESIYISYFDGGVLDNLRELSILRKKVAKYKNKWYRRLYHKYIKK
ncbi:glycosyltransferase family A protein [uncultured Bacteroides sp.]|uniref:glycosyltransferase family 2 protein n=1 Tax=uncultured Bacteroides sp. TaxID=162156 RepID=UPI0025F9AD15|nr:glycosyltransferase family A protein [uncultured Bacteroides sp.]